MGKQPRKRIPSELVQLVLYKCSRTCCVCRDPKRGVQLHHIDQDPSNNVEANLIALCGVCHDSAHTERKLSRNLTVTDLRRHKRDWESEVSVTAASAVVRASSAPHCIWAYINIPQLVRVVRQMAPPFAKVPRFKEMIDRGLIDGNGLPVDPIGPQEGSERTIWDRFKFNDSHVLHDLYSDVARQVLLDAPATDITELRSAKAVPYLLPPGSLCYLQAAFNFRSAEERDKPATRMGWRKARGLRVEFLLDLYFAWGSSARAVHLAGRNVASVLAVVRSVTVDKSLVVLRITPLAIGNKFPRTDLEWQWWNALDTKKYLRSDSSRANGNAGAITLTTPTESVRALRPRPGMA